MAENKEEGKMVSVFHKGESYGPLDTTAGRLAPQQSLKVPESLGKKLVGAYKHIIYTSDIVPESKKDEKAAADEKAKLGASIKALEKELDEAKTEHTKIVAELDKRETAIREEKKKIAKADESAKESQGKLAAALDEFLKAGSKKDLDALQAKHKDIFKA